LAEKSATWEASFGNSQLEAIFETVLARESRVREDIFTKSLRVETLVTLSL
jgi:hypothetical protein